MKLFKKLPQTIITPLSLPQDPYRNLKSALNIEILNVVNIMHVHDEPAHFFLGLRTQPHAYNELHHVQLYVYL